jgi:hypothetical protein
MARVKFFKNTGWIFHPATRSIAVWEVAVTQLLENQLLLLT